MSRKNATFALVIELHRHIEILLLDNDCVIIPDFGGLMAHHVESAYDDRDGVFLPPLRTLGFNRQLRLNDSLLAQSYVEAYDISYPEAVARIAEEVEELKQHLKNEGRYELNDLGVLFYGDDDNYTFEPCEAGILTPELYGLNSLEMRPYIQCETTESEEMPALQKSLRPAGKEIAEVQDTPSTEVAEAQTKEHLVIPVSWLRNAVAACIAVLVLFLFPSVVTDGGNGNMRQSMVDTGLLMHVLPKEMVLGHESVSNIRIDHKAKVRPQGKTVATKAVVQATDSSRSFFCLVLASKITRRNAQLFAQSLQDKGHREAEVLFRGKSVKVIYGHYATKHEADSAFLRLRSDEDLKDCWVMHVR